MAKINDISGFLLVKNTNCQKRKLFGIGCYFQASVIKCNSKVLVIIILIFLLMFKFKYMLFY
jgi:hypothetical protein